MSRFVVLGFAVAIAGCAVLVAGFRSAQHAPAGIAAPGAVSGRELPLAFVPNAGQFDARVRYAAYGSGYGLFFTDRGLTMSFARPGGRGLALALRFVGGNSHARLVARGRGSGTFSYFVAGGVPSPTRLSTYQELTYRDVWPGIDVSFRAAAGRLKYEFHVDPGADPADITLAYRGSDGLSTALNGDLAIATPSGMLTDERPVSYQGATAVPSSYRVLGDRYGFALPAGHDRTRPLVIDPGLAYSTFLGGSGDETGYAIAVDGQGSAYIAGRTTLATFPTSVGAFDTSFNGGKYDVFVTKLNPAGTQIVYSTFLGGSTSPLDDDLDDWVAGIALGADGSAYVTGHTASPDFPTTPGAYDRSFSGTGSFPYGTDAFVAKLNPSGTQLAYSTFLGNGAYAQAIAVDSDGSAFVAGHTSFGFPTTGGAYDTSFNGGNWDAFVTKLSSSGAQLVYSTYLGGSQAALEQDADDWAQGIAIDAQGSAYVTGWTLSSDFPTTSGAYDPQPRGYVDAFVTKLAPAGNQVGYSTYLGGTAYDQGQAITVDAQGSAYVAGLTDGSAFPTTAGAFDVSPNGGSTDAFVTKLAPAGNQLAYSTYLGGAASDTGYAIALDGQGRAHVTGSTTSADFPTSSGAYDTTLAGSADAYAAWLTPAGNALAYSTYLGGVGLDFANAIAVDSQRSVYVTGQTRSAAFPTSTSTLDSVLGGASDSFVTKLDILPPDTSVTGGPSGATSDTSPSFSFTSTESGSRFECSLDTPAGAGSFQTCATPRAYTTTANGNYTFSVRAKDTADNQDPTAATRAFTVDTVAPDTKLTAGPNPMTNLTSQSFSFDATEPGSTFECKLDSPVGPGSYASCASPQVHTTSANGAYRFSVRAKDQAGNQDTTPDTRDFTVDTVPPDTTITEGPSGVTDVRAPTFSFTSTEPGSTFECQIVAYQPCGTGHSFGDLPDGDHTFAVRATDPAGNTDPSPAIRSFTIRAGIQPPPPACRNGRSDGQPVGVTIASAVRFTGDPKVELTITPPDTATGLFISNDGGFTQPFAGPVNLGRHYPWALDSSGPERLPKTVYVRFAGACIDASQTFTDDVILDQTPPKLPTPTAHAPAKGRPVGINFKATDNASGVASVEVRRGRARIFAAHYRRTIRIKGSPDRLTARVRDGAGNNSPWKKVKVVRKPR